MEESFRMAKKEVLEELVARSREEGGMEDKFCRNGGAVGTGAERQRE